MTRNTDQNTPNMSQSMRMDLAYETDGEGPMPGSSGRDTSRATPNSNPRRRAYLQSDDDLSPDQPNTQRSDAYEFKRPRPTYSHQPSPRQPSAYDMPPPALPSYFAQQRQQLFQAHDQLEESQQDLKQAPEEEYDDDLDAPGEYVDDDDFGRDGQESEAGLFVHSEASEVPPSIPQIPLRGRLPRNPNYAAPAPARHNPNLHDQLRNSVNNPNSQISEPYESTASKLKKALQSTRKMPKRLPPEQDPENREIKRLRQQEFMEWGDIARILNDRRIANGQTPSLTAAAVYGRFTRNGPRIADLDGEHFNPSDYMHLKNPKPAAGHIRKITKWEGADDERLIEAHHEVHASLWEAISDRLYDKTGKRFTGDLCARRFNAL